MEYGVLVVVVADRPATPPIISLPMLGITPTNNASAADRRMSSLNLPSASLVMEEAMTLHLKRERELLMMLNLNLNVNVNVDTD